METTPRMDNKKLIIAFDFPFDALNQAKELAEQLDPARCRVKVGKQMFTDHGPAFVEWLQAHGFDVFLDLKFHDIPSTVAKAVSAAERLGVWMVNVHALGGPLMLAQARAALSSSASRPLLIAVTVLTSMDDAQLKACGISQSAAEFGTHLASLAFEADLDGVVCSAQECPSIKKATMPSFLTVCPGIRPSSAAVDDQSRIVTPPEAVRLGADFLVVGRPVTQSSAPMDVVDALLDSL
jgi:orotidine-5'-phosphate decarboxylase